MNNFYVLLFWCHYANLLSGQVEAIVVFILLGTKIKAYTLKIRGVQSVGSVETELK